MINQELHKKHWQTLVDQGMGYWNEDGEYCHLKPLALAIADLQAELPLAKDMRERLERQRPTSQFNPD